MWSVIKNNPISAFAVLTAAILAAFIGYMIVWQTNILASPTWCAKALGAEKSVEGSSVQQTRETLQTCNNLLLEQLGAIAFDSHINHAVVGLVVIVLFVVVIAGARASWKLSTSGLEGSVSRHDAAANAADKVAVAAVEEAAEIKGEPPEYNGPAMPEPKK